LLDAVKGDGQSDRSAANQNGDMSDSSEILVSEGTDDAVADGLTQRLAAIGRAEQRLAAGTYGRSITSGELISDERLEADPAAELTVDEAQQL
jgi:DnaK suppressor protein